MSARLKADNALVVKRIQEKPKRFPLKKYKESALDIVDKPAISGTADELDRFRVKLVCGDELT